MAFYEELSIYYDLIFPANQNQLNFFKHQFDENKAKRVLDIACGTGNFSIEFNKLGYRVTGIDLEEGMIEKARAKSKALSGIEFQVGDMQKLAFKDGSFDACVCIGNSLPHLIKLEEAQKAVSEMHRVLKEEGIAILQTVNYDRILKHKITELPLIEDKEEGVKFSRFYNFREDGLIDFNTELEIFKVEKKQVFNNSVVLRALMKRDMEEMLRKGGFKQLDFFGAFDGREYNEEAPATIVVAKK